MDCFNRALFCLLPCAFAAASTVGLAQTAPAKPSTSPVTFTVMDRTHIETWQFFAVPTYTNTYGYVESLLRLSVAERLKHFDWQLELSQPSVLDAPNDSISTVSAQGQLGLGASYYAANNKNANSAAAFLKQGFIRQDGAKEKVRLGRFEFVEGQEMTVKNPTVAWLQKARIAQRLIGNFGFTTAQRSFDGVDGHYSSGNTEITAAALRADQGVFNMNGNPELNVDVQYLAFTRSEFKQHLLYRGFAAGYHDGRTGLTKTDNRALAVRAADRQNIRVGTYGGDAIASIPVGKGNFDFLFWGAVQNGKWGPQDHSANAAAVEGGYQFTKLQTTPWLRGGWFRSSGDNNATDGTHNTFFQLLPTPRVYARLPFYNLMNNTDEFVQIMDKPTKNLSLRSDLHWLQLTSSHDLWYQGGGAFDNKVFGFVGRPSNGSNSLASVVDISADWKATKYLDVNAYYAYAEGKSVVGAIYPTDRNMNFGYIETVFHWGIPQAVKAK
jgi:hypothetical protein